MNRNTFVKRAVVGGGFLFLFAAPSLTFGQANPPGAARPAGVLPTRNQRPTYISPTEYLAGLTLTDDQKAKINQIREDTKSHLAAVAKDQKLGPEVKDAMAVGFQRIENSQIFEVLTPGQQQQVRRRIATLRAATPQAQDQAKQSTVLEQTPQPK